jgi:hypothetical protein
MYNPGLLIKPELFIKSADDYSFVGHCLNLYERVGWVGLDS